MKTQQISLTLPNVLYKTSKKYVEKQGYKNIQELVLDLLRKRIDDENIKRYDRISKQLDKQKGMTQKEAIKYFKNL